MKKTLPVECEYVGFGVVLLDENLNVLDVNREVVIKGGFEKEYAIGKNFLDFIPEDSREKIRKMAKKANEIGIERGIINVTAPSGRNFWLYLRFSRVDGGYIVTMVDISRMMNEQRSLAERNDELEILNRFISEVNSTLDTEVLYEKAYRELSGIVSNMDSFIISIVDEEHGEIWAEYVVGPEGKYEKKRFPLNDRDTLSGWVALHRKELYIKNVKKEKLPANFKLIGTPMLSWLGIPLVHRDRVLGVLSVQSRRENAFSERDLRMLRLIAGQLSMAIYNALLHRDLRRREEMYRALVDNSLVGIVMADASAKIKFVNRAITKMLGYSREELIGRCIYDFATEKSRSDLARGHERRTRGFTDTYETELKRKDGSTVYVMIYASPLRDEGGKIAGTMAAVADITPLKKMENKLKESKEFLELLLHVVGHDLKTPLSVISGYAELMREEPDPVYLDEINRSVERALGIIRDIRVLLKASMNENGSSVEEYSIADVIRDAIESVKEKYPEAKIESSLEDIYLCGNRVLMREALSNIILNAFKHGSTEVVVESRRKAKEIEVRIADNGPGISDERKEKVFEAFTKFDSGGSGLGLYIVKRVIEMHQGKIWVEDNEPHGAVFVIELPIRGCD